MRVRSSGSVVRSDLAAARRLIPAAWSEWAGLQFDEAGRLRDPDTGAGLPVLRLLQGRHRVPGATYRLDTGPSIDPVTRQSRPGAVDLTLVTDDGRRLEFRFSGPYWQAQLQLGDHPQATGTLDTTAALRTNQTPGCLVPVIGGAASTGQARVELSALDRGGEVFTAAGQAQRVAIALTAEVRPTRGEWNGRIELHLSGRGLLGRTAALLARRPLRRALQRSLDDLWKDLDQQATALHRSLASLDAELRAGGGERAWLHRELWQALRAESTRSAQQ